tara:strand:- start:639 stop:1133 length:495 start_codon:yes stop_codon:yes gene_type:complete
MGSNDLILIGKVIKATGIDGFLIVQAYSEKSNRFIANQEFHIDNKRYIVENTKNSNKNHKVKFYDVNSLDEAKNLIGKDIMQSKAMLPNKNKDSFYHYQILDSNVLTDKGNNLGKVVEIIETGSNDVLVVRNNKEEILIPLLSGVLIKYNEKTNTLIVQLPYKI